MAKKIKISGCPFCGHKAFWTKGDRTTGVYDRVCCLNCDAEIEEDYTPQSAVEKWNFRVLDHYVQSVEYNIDGERCD